MLEVWQPSEEMVEKAALAVFPQGHHRLCEEGRPKCTCYFQRYRNNAIVILKSAHTAILEEHYKE